MRKIFFTLAFFHISLFTFGVYAQSITWQKIYNGPAYRNDVSKDVCVSTDGYFYVVGYTFVMGLGDRIYILKLNQYGDTIWTKIIGNTISGPSALAYAVASTNDGGCVLTGDWDSAFTIKVNGNGTIGWQKFYGGSFIQCYDIMRTSNGDFIACGRDVNSTFDGYVLKINFNGDLVWQRSYTIGYTVNFKAITETADRSYILAGLVLDNSQDTVKGYILKTDTSGNEIWEKKFKINNLNTGCVSISEIQGNYLIGGNTNLYGIPIYQPFFAKMSLNGDTLFSHVYSDTSYLHQIRPISSNRYVISMTRDSNVPPPISLNEKARVVVTDSLGTILHEKVFFNGKYDELTTVLPLSNGDIIFSGYTEPLNSEYKDIYLVRTDSNLNAPPIIIEPIGNKVPLSFMLYQNYPNPFNSSTIIKFAISKQCDTKLIIYDILGREIKTFIEKDLKPGSYEVKWNADNFSSDVYFVMLIANGYRYIRKMVLIK